MIIGIGTDIIEIDRVGKAVENKSFVEKNFTGGEILLCEKSAAHKAQTLAGNFAAKESVAKALSSGFRGFGLRDVEILRQENGKPVAILTGGAKELAESLGIKKIHLSISHCEKYAAAVAVAED